MKEFWKCWCWFWSGSLVILCGHTIMQNGPPAVAALTAAMAVAYAGVGYGIATAR